MLQQMKMYGLFVGWILRKVFTFGGRIPAFFAYWVEAVTEEFSLSAFMYLLVLLVSLLTNLIVWIIYSAGEKPPIAILIYALVFATSLYACVIVTALYQVFLQEYEESFTILKQEKM